MDTEVSEANAARPEVTSQATQVDLQAKEPTKTLETPASIPGSSAETEANNESPGNMTFVEKIAQYRVQLDHEFQEFERTLAQRSRDQELKDMNWNEFEERYDHEMSLKIADERDIMNEFSARFTQFMLWMQVSNEKEAERALKRLRTRVAFVQHSEEQLDEKQQHYATVLEAFQAAMQLFRSI